MANHHEWSCEVEFCRSKQFKDFLKYFFVQLDNRLARRQNKNGSAETKQSILSKLVFRILSDAARSQTKLSTPEFYFAHEIGQSANTFPTVIKSSISVSDVLARACFFLLTSYMVAKHFIILNSTRLHIIYWQPTIAFGTLLTASSSPLLNIPQSNTASDQGPDRCVTS